MRYPSIRAASFVSRPNRFIAHCEDGEGRPLVAHVKNTGRCQELLSPGARVFLSEAENPARKTAFDLVAVQKGALLINMDSQAPNQLVYEALAAGRPLLPGMEALTGLRREFAWQDSRFDLMAESGPRRALIEVKGVTLEEEGLALFPDAPTQRGVKHLEGLTRAVGEGWLAFVLFVAQFSPAEVFRPNWAAHPAFGRALARAARAGVRPLCFDCRVSPGELWLGGPVPMDLAEPNG